MASMRKHGSCCGSTSMTQSTPNLRQVFHQLFLLFTFLVGFFFGQNYFISIISTFLFSCFAFIQFFINPTPNTMCRNFRCPFVGVGPSFRFYFQTVPKVEKSNGRKNEEVTEEVKLFQACLLLVEPSLVWDHSCCRKKLSFQNCAKNFMVLEASTRSHALIRINFAPSHRSTNGWQNVNRFQAKTQTVKKMAVFRRRIIPSPYIR